MADTDSALAETDRMWALIGRCITRWSFVEENLSQIFAICTSPTCARPEGGIHYLDTQVPMTVFYSGESFRGKLSLADAAVSARLLGADAPSESLVEWSRLKDKCRKLSQKRNKLAHWTVLPAFNDGRLFPARLVPSIGSPGYYKETALRPAGATLRPANVGHLDLAFCLLNKKLEAFKFALARREELFDSSVELLERQLEQLDDTDPTRAERLRRAASSRG